MAKLLVAEDESALRMLLADTLEDEGYETDLACDGEEALNRLYPALTILSFWTI